MAHAQLWACCRVSVIDRVRSRLRARVRITVRVRVCPGRLQALTPTSEQLSPQRAEWSTQGRTLVRISL